VTFMFKLPSLLFLRPIASLLLFILILLAGPVQGGQYHCAGLDLIEITAPDHGMVKNICQASAKAVAFLANYRLGPKRLINIKIIETIIDNHGYLAYGSYDRQSDLIELISLPAILKSTPPPQMYGQPFDREHYQAAIAHEIAHAIFQHNCAEIKEQLTSAAQEYLAHATQMGVLSDKRRNEIIKANKVEPWESGDSIDVTYMAIDPTGFAVKSYLHLTRMADPQPFIRLLLRNNWFYLSVP